MAKISFLFHAAYVLSALFAYSCLNIDGTAPHAQFVQERGWRSRAEEAFPEPLKKLNSTMILQIFQKHCNWSAPHSKESFADFTTTQKLIEGSALHCANSALPYASVDVWYHQADVRIISGASVEVVRAQLHEKCNTNTERACIIFLETFLLSDTLGCSLLLEMLKRPFVLITADNRDNCVPFSTYPASASSSEIDLLIASPLLIRWYSKVRSIHA
jgi:hypothetical protein